MGLDIVIYKKDNQRKIVEIKENLHKIIFSTKFDLSKMNQLVRLRDYYKTNVHLNADEVEILIKELKVISQHFKDSSREELNTIINELSIPDLQKAHITGD